MSINTIKVNRVLALNPAWRKNAVNLLLLIVLLGCLVYLSVTSERIRIYVLTGLLLMAISIWRPFRNLSEPMPIRMDLFAFMLALFVYASWYEFLVEQPVMSSLMTINWVDRFRQWIASYPLWLAIICNYIASDFLAYWSHRLFHSRYFWPFHAFHHSSKHLNWLSGMRSSFAHTVGLLLPYTLVWVFFPMPKAGLVSTGLLVFDTINQHYLHTNIRFPLQKQLEWLFVTPRFHFVHHSAARVRSDSNFGFIFSIWDRWFGTYTDPNKVDPNEPLGLNYNVSDWRLILGLPPGKSR